MGPPSGRPRPLRGVLLLADALSQSQATASSGARLRTTGVDAGRLLFSELNGRAPFHRDSALGRVFHPGTVSYREITTSDSLHITVSPENRVSVHVDRLSPLAVRPCHPCRYSLLRAVAHNVVHVAEAIVLLFRHRPSQHRCQLDCEDITLKPSPQRL